MLFIRNEVRRLLPKKKYDLPKNHRSNHPNKSSQEKLPKILEKTDRNEVQKVDKRKW